MGDKDAPHPTLTPLPDSGRGIYAVFMRLRKKDTWIFCLTFAGFAACSGSNEDSQGGDGDAAGDGDGDTAGDGDGDTAGDGDGDAAGDGDGDTAGDGDGDLGGGPGDGDMGGASGDGDGDGDAAGDGDGDGGPLVSNPADAECNLAGVWAVVTKTRTQAASMDQIANRWYFFEISQDGEAVEVVRGANCQVRVEDDDEIISTVVTISDEALQGILDNSSPAGLRGTFSRNGDVCDLDLERQYFVLGLPESYLPLDPESRPDLADLPPLPTEEDPDGAEDWDGDGQLGLGFQVASLASGTRSSVQRSYIEFDSDSNNPDYTIDLSSSEFTVNNLTAISESVLSASGEFLKTVGTLEGTDHPVTFTRLGDTHETAELPSGAPLPEGDFDLCKTLEEEFPFSL